LHGVRENPALDKWPAESQMRWFYPVVRWRVFTILSVVSLLLCLGTAALWARSYSTCDRLCWGRETVTRDLMSYEGEFQYTVADNPDEKGLGGRCWYDAREYPSDDQCAWREYAVGEDVSPDRGVLVGLDVLSSGGIVPSDDCSALALGVGVRRSACVFTTAICRARFV